MPRYIIEPGPPPKRDSRLTEELVGELRPNDSTKTQPLILEEKVPHSQVRHVRVIWDKWKGVPDDRRTAIIVEAYSQVEGPEVESQIEIASGLTPEEALVLGYLPFKVVPVVQGGREDNGPAIEEEARSTLLGSGANELRYATLKDARRARERLKRKWVGSRWKIVSSRAPR